MCLRFVVLLITRLAAGLRLAMRAETWKTAEILLLRHQFAVLQRHQPCRPKLNWAADAGSGSCSATSRRRMNAIAERWIGGCRRELLDRTLIWNQTHLRRILPEYETHHNQHRPHGSLHGAAPLKPLPEPVDLDQYRVRKQAHVAGLINEYRLVA
jgi:transposase InsO family protein